MTKNFKSFILAHTINCNPKLRVAALLANHLSLSFDNNNRERSILSLINENPVEFLCNLISNMDQDDLESKMVIDCADDDYRQSSKLTILGKTSISSYARILEVSLLEYGYYGDSELCSNINDSEIVLDILYLNSFEGTVIFNGYIKGDHIDYELAEDRGFGVNMHVKGIKKDSHLPLWFRYIVDAVLYAKAKDIRSSILFCYVSIESFISFLHDDLIFSNILDIGKGQSNYKENVQCFAIKKKPIRHKISDVLKYLGIAKDNTGFIALNQMLENWLPKLEKLRHIIAHGVKDPPEIDINEIIYKVLTIELSICLCDDLALNQWESITE